VDRDLRRALGHVRPHARRLVLVVVLSLAGTVMSLAMPVLSRTLVDDALLGRDMRALLWTMAGFLGLTAASFLFNVASGLRYTRVSADILFDMRREVFRHLQRLSPRYFARTPIGQIASRINSDIGEIQRVAAEVALAWIGHTVFLVGSVVMLFVLDLRMFAAALITVPPALWALVRYRRRLEGAVAETRDRGASVGTFLIESLQGMKLLVATNAQDRSVDEFRRRNDAFIDALMRMRRLTYFSGGLPGMLLAIGSAAVLLYGGTRVIDGTLTMGTLVAFAAYQMRLLVPVQGLMGIFSSVASARVSLRRVNEILDTPVDVADAAATRPLPRARGAVTLDGVSFAYDDGRAVLDGVTLQIAPGECLAIVGASGGGKSTIADLLVRHLDPQQGRIRLDGHDLRDLALADVRRHVAVLEQEPFIFHASLADNLRIAAPRATDSTLHQALAVSGLDEWARAAATGLATIVGERGRAVSAGERQRLSLARAYLADPAVIVLDEATGSLDPALERRVVAGLASWMRGRTTILITHRLDVARRATRVVVLQDGRVAEDGPADALLARRGDFARLFLEPQPVA
jgi:ATP-binding cassette subfamily B protein